MGDAQHYYAKGLTMLEMIISLAMILTIFAVILPQFKNIQNSWASKQGAAEAVQNARVVMDFLNRHLAQAAIITVVSDPCDTTGYIEFEGNDGNNYRYEIGADNIVEFGPVGSLVDLAGPVSQLQFTCYDDHDLDTPITTVGEIRCVNVEITLTNAAGGRDQTFTAKAYLRTNAIEGSGLIAHWKFDEGSGTVAADSSAYNYNATIVGPTWIAGDSCVWLAQATQSALDFGRPDDYVDIDSEITGLFNGLTLAAWVKFRDHNSLYAAIFSSDQATDYTHLSFPEDNGWLEFEVSVGGDRFQVIAADTDITLGQWYHVAATYDNSEPALAKLYIDGALDFDGSDDYVNTHITAGSITNVTFCLWFQSDDAGSIGDDEVEQRFVTLLRPGTSKSKLALGINNNKLAAYWHDGNSNVGQALTTLNAGQWYHAVLTYDGSVIKIYLDGVEENSFSEPALTSQSSGMIQVGRNKGPEDGDRFFDGLLDDVRIYRRALTATKIQAICNQNEYCCSVQEQILP